MTLVDQPAPGTYRLTRTRLDAVAAALRASANQRIAATRAGISERTYRVWRDRGWEDLKAYLEAHDLDPADLDYETFLAEVPFEDQPFCHFCLTIEKARVDFVLLNLAAISQEAVGTMVEEIHETTTTTTNPDGSTSTTTVVRTVRKPRKSWQAAAWLLERTFPNEYARVIRQEISGRGGDPIEVDVQEIARQEVREKLRQMRENTDAAARIIDAESWETAPGSDD